MFSILTNIMLLWEKSKQSALAKQKAQLNRLKLTIDAKTQQWQVNKPDDDTQVNKKLSTTKFKVHLLTLLSSLLSFFEMLPIFFTFIYMLLLFVALVGVVIVIMMVNTFIQGLLKDVAVNFQTPPDAVVAQVDSIGNAQWSEAELAIRGIQLTDYEKNLYRLVLLSKKAIQGYGGKPLVSRYGTSEDIATAMLVGISSTETGMNFYQGSKSYDLLKIPSDIPPNSLGYGFLGLSSSKTLNSYYDSTVTANIKATYSPSVTPSYEASFAPWGTAMSAKHLYNDLSGSISSSETEAVMDKTMDAFGIKENRAKLKEYLAWFLAQAEYQGAVQSEYPGYIAFWCALYASTSDNDADRSFDRWSIVADNYSESTMRQLVLGSTPHRNIGTYASPIDLPKSKTTAYLTLNGVKIDKPLWSFVYEKYGSIPKIKDSWSQAVRFANSGGGVADRVLNYHYGFNSLLQGNKVMKHISSKLIGFVYAQTPGKGQGLWNGKDIVDFVNSYDSAYKQRALQMQRYWGTASFITAQKIKGVDWKPDKWGVPFYIQDGSSETYSNVAWGRPDDTFSQNGCMIYSFAYAASALTGKLINPPEMASAMYITNALVDGGVVPTALPKTYAALGLKYELVTLSPAEGICPTGTAFDNVWTKVDATLDNGGIVVVRGGYPWTSSKNHFFVITSKSIQNGTPMYSIYSSYNVPQSMTMWSKSAFEGTLHKEVYLITK